MTSRIAIAGVMLGLGCGPAIAEPSEPGEPGESRAPMQAAELVPVELRELNVAIEPGWAAASTVWVVADYWESTYPCRPGPDGSLDMILQQAFTPTRVLKGTLAIETLDVDAAALKGPDYPPGLTEGRSYLLMLAPRPEIAARLADPQGHLGMYERLDRSQIVAVVDLSQSADERASEAVSASRSGTRKGVRFDPQRWAAARAAPAIAAEQAELGGFVAAQLLARSGASVAEVRSWLGAPDELRRSKAGLLYRYWLARPRYEKPVDGGVYGQVELRFLGDLLHEGSVRYFRWEVRPDGSSSSFELSGEGLRERGLVAYALVP
jgi:hypothetical protein